MKKLYIVGWCLGILGLVLIGIWTKNFTIEIPPDPATSDKWYWILANMLVIIGLTGILLSRRAFTGCLICAVVILVFSYGLKIIPRIRQGDWVGFLNNADGWEILATVGGFLIVANSFRSTKGLLPIGLFTMGCFFVWAGVTHFLQTAFVATLIPSFIPFHLFWTYFCGVCLMGASIAFWIPVLRLWALRLCGLMIFSWLLIVHIPLYLSDHSIFHLMEICEALAISSALGVAAVTCSPKRN
jgi:uncharacterized membrane protein